MAGSCTDSHYVQNPPRIAGFNVNRLPTQPGKIGLGPSVPLLFTGKETEGPHTGKRASRTVAENSKHSETNVLEDS